MKKVFLLVIILILGGLIAIGGRAIQSGELGRYCKENPSLFRFAVLNNLCTRLNLNATLKCSYTTHICESFVPQKDSGDFKITLTVDGRPGKGIEIDLWLKSSPSGESFIKNTDEKGVALFKGIPPNVYSPSANPTNFPKRYGKAYETWTWESVTVVKGKMTEMKMDLHSSPTNNLK